MREQPLISIVTLSYNNFFDIFETIASVLKQNYPKIEYIISDDGSNKFPKEQIESYIRKNAGDNLISYKLITNKENSGTVKNINNAYRCASGKYLLPLSTGDIFFDNTVCAQIVGAFEKNKYEVLCCRRLRCNNNLLPIRYMPCEKYIRLINKLDTPIKQYTAIMTENFYEAASGSVTYLSKKFIEKWGYFDEKYDLWEDGPFYAQYTRTNCKLNFDFNIIAIKYREGGISTSGKKNKRMENDLINFTYYEGLKYINKFNLINRRKLQYIYQRKKLIQSDKSLFTLKLKYLDIMFLKALNRLISNYAVPFNKKNSKSTLKD